MKNDKNFKRKKACKIGRTGKFRFSLYRLILLITAFVENQFCWFCCHSDEGGIA